jgi:2-polyprenyl-3-methyl-5-hydroxy-6-metoxy-1,4-benzoquinol methylase
MNQRSNDSTLRYYDERTEEYVARTEQLDMTALYEPFLAFVPAGGAILDAGCGPGRDVQEFARRGYRVKPFDASARMVEVTKQRTGIAAAQMRFQELNYDQEFDGVWACASLLHVPLDELLEVFDRLRRSLKLHGVCFMSFKHGAGERTDDGRQFVDFSETTLGDELRKVTGLSVIRIWTTDDQAGRSSIRWVNALVGRSA